MHRERVRQLQTEARLPEDTPGKQDYVALSSQLRQERQGLQKTISQIQAEAPDFMPSPTFADIQAAATESPLVYIIATSAGGLALIVDNKEIISVWLDALTEDALREQVQGPDDDSDWGGYLGAYFNRHKNPRTWFNVLDETITWLSETTMKPLCEQLPAHTSHITLIPSGLLGLLPLHAAGDERITFTYAPNARALSSTQNIAARVKPPYTLFAVDNPDGTLHTSSQEVDAVVSHFTKPKPWVVQGEKATRNTALQALQEATVLHFSCHGANNWIDPLDSALFMYPEKENKELRRLTLRDILTTQSPGARLAFLSACETGIPGAKLPDEAVMLPTGLLQAGVAGVISTLWSVNDASTAALSKQFYHYWLDEEDSPPVALHRAQQWLRTTEGGKWAHPYFWAGFTYTGV